MHHTDYNNYMLNLYKDCSIKLSNHNQAGLDYEIKSFFEQNASLFNSQIANEFLSKLNNKNYNLIEKMESFPYMFWKTPESKVQITKGLEKLQQKYQHEITQLIEDSQSNINHSAYTDEEILSQTNTRLNGELGTYKDTYGTGIFKDFSKDMLKIHLGLGDKVNVVPQIEQFATFAYNTFNQAQLQVDFSEFPKFLQKIFKNTPISDNINNINFNQLLGLSQTSKLKV